MSDEISLSKGWSLDAYVAHNEAMRVEAERFHAERDRRYTEVALEREKALKIKETADLAALGLAREIQTYKDEKANQLREQINAERGLYPTRSELDQMAEKLQAVMQPVIQYVATQQGRSSGTDASWVKLVSIVGMIGVLLAIVAAIIKWG